MKAYSIMLMLLTTSSFAGDEPVQNGRYQLVSGPDPINLPQQSLYRIDTQTGKVWQLHGFKVPSPKGERHVPAEGWTPVSEDFGAAIHFASLAAGADPASLTNRWSTTNQMELDLNRSSWPPLKRETFDRALQSEMWAREDIQGKSVSTNAALRNMFPPFELGPYKFLTRTNKAPESQKK